MLTRGADGAGWCPSSSSWFHSSLVSAQAHATTEEVALERKQAQVEQVADAAASASPPPDLPATRCDQWLRQ